MHCLYIIYATVMCYYIHYRYLYVLYILCNAYLYNIQVYTYLYDTQIALAQGLYK